ncbi:MAG: TonB-dependent receptor, partial [Acidobacteria bacterium]|nr:TonB-dependent receptor [Acidobacteriota bacterium]
MRSSIRFCHHKGLMAVLMLASASTLWPQATSSLRGTVTDAQGSAVEMAAVRLEGNETGWKRTVLTDTAGAYQFSQVPPGNYVVLVEKQGFAILSQRGVQLLVNTPATLNLTLEVASVSQTVNVESEVTRINAVDATIGNAFNEAQVRQLPLLTRNVVELLSLQPGVTPTGEVLGARRDQNNITLDGVDVNDNQTAGLEGGPNGGYNNSNTDRPGGFNAALPVPLDSVQEFRVTVGGQNANQGRSSGGQVSLITKGGSNQFHGSAYEYHRNTVTSANNWFNNRAGVGREPLIRNQFGASAGGRIVRNRAFFFLNYEQRIDASGYSQSRRVPSESFKNGEIRLVTNDNITRTLSPADVTAIDPLHRGASPTITSLFKQMPVGNDPSSGLDRGLNFSIFRFNAPFRLDNKAYVGKMDFRLDEAGMHTLSLRGTLAGNSQDDANNLAPYPGLSPAARLLNNSRGLSALYTSVLRPNLVNLATFGLTRIGIERTGSTQTGFTLDTIDLPTNFTRGYVRLAPTYNITDDITWTKSTHTVTTGLNFRFIRNDRTSFANAFPNYSYSRGSLSGLGADIVTDVENALGTSTGASGLRLANGPAVSRAFGDLLGLITSGSMTYSYDRKGNPLSIGTPPHRQFASNDYELYIADSWRVKPSLTLTYGVRWTKFGVPYEQNGLQVAPTFSPQAFYAERIAGMTAGIPTYQLPHAVRQFDWNGRANGKDGWYGSDNNNLAPRFSFAYSPGNPDSIGGKLLGKSGVFRGGASIVHDRFGSQLVTNFDESASFGLTEIKNLGQSVNFTTGPRYNGTFPTIPNASTHTFPFTPPNVDFIGGNYMGIASDLKAPYSIVLNASFARELPGGLTLEAGYAGRLSRGLLMQIDTGGWALLFKDPKSGITWKQMSREMR